MSEARQGPGAPPVPVAPGAGTEPRPLPDLGTLARAAYQLRPPFTHEKKGVLRPEAAHLIDSLLARVARSRGALDVAIGDCLAPLADGDRLLQLGYSCLADYARERLGMAGRTAQAVVQLARGLRTRPVLRDAVRRGDVSVRKAQVVLHLAEGDAEESWVARARSETVRALEAAVRAADDREQEGEQDDRWDRVCVPLSARDRARLDEAMALAGKVLGPSAPHWQRLEAICQRIVALLAAAFRAARAEAGYWLTPEECLLRMAEHFVAT